MILLGGPQHVYVHVPFCRRRCVYCDFSIAIRDPVPSGRFADAVRAELRVRNVDVGDAPATLATMYFGGGTPSLLDPGALQQVMSEVLAWSGAQRIDDVTLEANPEDVTFELARAWRACGVTRISLGVQSFQDRVLEWMHRPHDAAAVPRAVDAVRSAGIDSLSLDLIIGIPTIVGPDMAKDLRRAIELAPDHLSVYTLTVEPRTPLGKWSARSLIEPAPDVRCAAEFLAVHDVLSTAGFEHYEVSNYARPGRRARHNSAYWSGRDYLGLGPGAHSLLGGVRSWNLDQWAAYERAVASGGSGEADRERLTESQRRLERTYLGLRTAAGLALSEVTLEANAVQVALQLGWGTLSEGRFRLTPEGWLRLDALVGALTTDPEGG